MMMIATPNRGPFKHFDNRKVSKKHAVSSVYRNVVSIYLPVEAIQNAPPKRPMRISVVRMPAPALSPAVMAL